MNKAESVFRLVLCVFGTSSLLAVLAVVMPEAWMNAIHRLLFPCF